MNKPEYSDDTKTQPGERFHSPIEPAYQYPGVPEGTTLSEYIGEGFAHMKVHLTQHARKN